MLGQLFAILTAFCWAQNSIVYNIAGKRVSSQTVAHIRLWIAFPAILILHLLFLGTLLPELTYDRSLIYLIASGFIGFCVADLFIFYSFVVLGPGRTMLFLTLVPIFSALMSFLFIHESLHLMQILGIFTTVGGILLVVFYENKISTIDPKKKKGIIIALMGTLSQSAAMILSKMGMGDLHPISANVVRIFTGLVALSAYALIRKSFVKDFKKMKDVKSLSLITIGAFIGPVLGIILTLSAFQLAPVGIVTTLTQMSPIILLPIEAIFFKRRITWGILLGTFVAFGGAVLLFLF